MSDKEKSFKKVMFGFLCLGTQKQYVFSFFLMLLISKKAWDGPFFKNWLVDNKMK
jgi:hypothetical protein